MCNGRLFNRSAAATGNALSPTVGRRSAIPTTLDIRRTHLPTILIHSPSIIIVQCQKVLSAVACDDRRARAGRL